MQQLQQSKARPVAERQRVEAIVETLANLRNQGETVAEVAHDARNMVTALGLYCDLLEEPGVLAVPFTHYGNELRLVAAASRRLVEKLVNIDHRRTAEPPMRPVASRRVGDIAGKIDTPGSAFTGGSSPSLLLTPADSHSISERNRLWDLLPAEPIKNLAAELMANRHLLSSLAGPAITLTADTDGGAQPVRLTGEDLTRVLINLIKNACEALPSGGRIQIALSEQKSEDAAPRPNQAATTQVTDCLAPDCLRLIVEDNGPGIPEEYLEKIFNSGFSAPAAGEAPKGSWPSTHRGLGLAITRSIIEAAGGRIRASNRLQGGACFTIELPVTR